MPTTREEFESIFPFVRETVLSHAKKYGLPAKELEWFERSLNYNCLGGKYNRGMSVPDTAAILMGDAALSGEEYKMTAMLGWLTELLQAFFLVSDDIMDSSVTRRGQPCWFRNREVGMVAINDAFLLEMGIYMTLRQHFRAHPAYLDVVELFQETTFQTECGQLCDLLTAPDDETASLDRFSLEKWSFIVVYKTAWYSFYLPVALALHYLRLATPGNLAQCERILIPLGEYFQAQDDYLDAFGSPEQIGKVGTDIQDNKCSWLANQALKLATPAQRKVLDDNYGRKDAAHEAAVKALWRELQLDRVYQEFEEERVGALRKMIDEVDESEGLKKEIFDAFLKKIYKRSK